MSDPAHSEIVIVRRGGHGHEEGHHGGVWKIAFADFMTALMAFFLVLWIVNSSSKETKSAIARYFNPVKLSETTPARRGLRDAKETDSDASSGEPGQARADAAKTDAAKEGSSEKTATADDCQQDSGSSKGTHGKDTPKDAHGAEDHGKDAHGQNAKAPAKKGSKSSDCNAMPMASQGTVKLARYGAEALFLDPYAVLSEISASRAEDELAKPPSVLADKTRQEGKAGHNAVEPFRDPFAPLAPVLSSRAGEAPPSLQATRRQPENLKSGGAVLETAEVKPVVSDALQLENLRPESSPELGGVSEKPIVMRQERQGSTVDLLKSEMAQALGEDMRTEAGLRIDIRGTQEGTLVTLMDGADAGMFAIGSAEPGQKTLRIMEKIARVLKSFPGAVIIRGHTDARAYGSGSYDNWRLSADRAQMAYHMMVRGGLQPARLERIEGYADRRLKTPQTPQAAENRRVEILIRREKL